MTANELALIAKKMRDAQRCYFKQKREYGSNAGLLAECKNQEKLLDRAIRDVLGDTGPGLFDEEVA